MIVEYVRYQVAEGQGPELEAAYARAAEPMRASPHCLAFELARCDEDAKVYVLRIEWDSSEGHLQGFRKGPEFAAFLAAIKPFIPAIVEMRHYAQTGVVFRR